MARARAGAMQSSRVRQQSPSAESDSQLVFGNVSRGQRTYGSTPEQRRQKITPRKEILEYPEKLRFPSNEVDDTGIEYEVMVLRRYRGLPLPPSSPLASR